MRFQSYLLLHVPLAEAIKRGSTAYGYEKLEVTDSIVQAVPEDLRDWLVDMIREADIHVRSPEDRWPLNCCLHVASFDVTPEMLVDALRRSREEWLESYFARFDLLDDEDLVERGDGDIWQPLPELEHVAADPRGAELLARARAEVVRRGEADIAMRAGTERVREGLRAYALNIPAIARPARDGYEVARAALDHFLQEVAAFDEDALVFNVDSKQEHSKLEPRKLPNEHAFKIFDAFHDHVEKLPRPDGLDISFETIQRYRRGVQKNGKWTFDLPVTVVSVRVNAFHYGDWRVIVFADAEDKRSLLREQQESNVAVAS